MTLNAQTVLKVDSFKYTGSVQTFVFPSCVSAMTVMVEGAQGGLDGASNGHRGYGGYIAGVLTSSAGIILHLNVGGAGTGSVGGFNGGGNGGQGTLQYGGGGGGATDIRLGGNSLSHRIIVAGGGGGSGAEFSADGGGGANFGGIPCGLYASGGFAGSGTGSGGSPGACLGGVGNFKGGAGGGVYSGGATSGIGIGSYGQAGALGLGGNGGGALPIYGGGGTGGNGAGGGGSGYYGGAGGMADTAEVVPVFSGSGGGGGGSSYADSILFSNISFSGTGGYTFPDGLIILKYFMNGPSIAVNTNTLSICNGGSATLTANNVSTYTWLPTGTFAGSNASSIVVSPTITTNYSVLGTNAFGCVTQTVIALNVLPELQTTSIASSPSNTICVGGTIVLSVNAINCSWINSINSSTLTTPTIIVSPVVSTIYSVTSIDSMGCKNTSTIELLVETCSRIQKVNRNDMGIKIYPNPTNGLFMIHSDSELKLNIINQFGENVKTIHLSQQNNWEINIADLSTGLYFIVGRNGDSTFKEKLVVVNP